MAKSTLTLRLPVRFLDEDTTVSKDTFCLNGRIELDTSRIGVQLESVKKEFEKTLSAELYKKIISMKGRYKK